MGCDEEQKEETERGPDGGLRKNRRKTKSGHDEGAEGVPKKNKRKTVGVVVRKNQQDQKNQEGNNSNEKHKEGEKEDRRGTEEKTT